MKKTNSPFGGIPNVRIRGSLYFVIYIIFLIKIKLIFIYKNIPVTIFGL